MAFPPPGNVVSDFNIADFGPCSCPIEAYKRGGVPVPHWRSLVDSKYLNHTELQGKDCSVRIRSTNMDTVIGSGGVKSKKGLIYFDGKTKAMVAGVAVLSAIASIYGDDIAGWPGKWITLYPTTTEASGKTVGTIRVRPTAPKGKQVEPKDEREPGGEG